METSIPNAFDLIGLCLAPFEESRAPLLAAAAFRVKDWEELMRLCGARFVTPLVFVRLRNAGVLDQVPESIRESFERLYLNVASLNALRLHQVLKVSSLLSTRNVPMLYRKGSSLVMAGDYPDPGQRMFSDIDTLVKKDNFPELRRAFAELGEWRELENVKGEDWTEYKWLDRFENMVEVRHELKPLNGVPGEVPLGRLWARAEEVEYRGKRALIPCREDRFLQAAIHSTAHHAFDSAYLFLTMADLAHLARGNLDWKRLAAAAKEDRMLEHVTVACELAQAMTRCPRLADGVRILHDLEPGLQELTEPLSRGLLRMAYKPWLFYSGMEMLLFTDKGLASQVKQVLALLRRRVAPGSRTGVAAAPGESPEPEVEVEGVRKPRYERKLLDPDFLGYLVRLYRFYRRTNYLPSG